MTSEQIKTEIERREQLVKVYRETLEAIAHLADATMMRGPLEDIGVPEHLVKNGWVPIHPQFKRGLVYAANLAKIALSQKS